MRCCLCASILCDDDEEVVRTCEEFVCKGNHTTQCKRLGKYYNEFDKKFYCDLHFNVKQYIEKKYPSDRRNSQFKRKAFVNHITKKINDDDIPKRTSLDLSLSSDES